MSKLGKRMIAAADEALAVARREADPETYRLHLQADLMEARRRRLAAVDVAIERGIADIEAGRTHDGDTVFDLLEARYTGMAREHGEK